MWIVTNIKNQMKMSSSDGKLLDKTSTTPKSTSLILEYSNTVDDSIIVNPYESPTQEEDPCKLKNSKFDVQDADIILDNTI